MQPHSRKLDRVYFDVDPARSRVDGRRQDVPREIPRVSFSMPRSYQLFAFELKSKVIRKVILVSSSFALKYKLHRYKVLESIFTKGKQTFAFYS